MELTTTTPASILSIFDTTKEQRLSFCTMLLEALTEGDIDILKVHKHIKSMAEIETILTDRSEKNKHSSLANQYHSLLQDAASKYGKEFQLHNATFKTMEAGVRYDFTLCGDDVWDTLAEQAAAIKLAMDERQAYLKALPASGIEIVDKESGEVVKLWPPTKKSTTTISCSLK